MVTTQDKAIEVITDATTLANATLTSCIDSIREIKDNATIDIINSIQNTEKDATLNLRSEKESIIQELTEIRDKAITDIVSF